MEFIDDISEAKCKGIVEHIKNCCLDPEIQNIIIMLAKPLDIEKFRDEVFVFGETS